VTARAVERRKRKLIQCLSLAICWSPADFLPQTANIRNDPTWQGPPPAPGMIDRRVEITGPVDRKMVINALNSGATQFMADFEGGHLQQ